MPETCRHARDEVEDLLFENGAKSFYPLDRLRKYFRLQKVREILSCSCAQCREDVRLYGHQIDPELCAEDIVGEGRDPNDLRNTHFSIFGLLIVVEHPLFIIGFLKTDCSDFMLESWATNATSFSHYTLEQRTGRYRRDTAKFNRFARKFLADLPSFAVPHMKTERFLHYDARVILPFIDETEIGKRMDEYGHWTSEGANGKVFSFKIYPEYRKFLVSINYTPCIRQLLTKCRVPMYQPHSSENRSRPLSRRLIWNALTSNTSSSLAMII